MTGKTDASAASARNGTTDKAGCSSAGGCYSIACADQRRDGGDHIDNHTIGCHVSCTS